MADDLRKLLLYIVDNHVMRGEAREAQLDATAVQNVPEEIKAIAEDRRGDAERLGDYFARGLRLAAAGGGSLVVDDSDPEGNGIADAFARFLVTPNLATSQSIPISEGRYRYTFEIDWPRLHDISQKAGIDLDAALSSSR
jgi:hypothetical protein